MLKFNFRMSLNWTRAESHVLQHRHTKLQLFNHFLILLFQSVLKTGTTLVRLHIHSYGNVVWVLANCFPPQQRNITHHHCVRNVMSFLRVPAAWQNETVISCPVKIKCDAGNIKWTKLQMDLSLDAQWFEAAGRVPPFTSFHVTAPFLRITMDELEWRDQFLFGGCIVPTQITDQ